MNQLYLLLESAAGYFLLRIEEWDQIGTNESIEKKILKPDVFNRMVHFCSFVAFETAEKALENLCLINEGKASSLLLHFLEMNLPSDKTKYSLGVSDIFLGKSLSNVGFNVLHNSDILELYRVCREYFFKRLSKYMDNADVTMKSFHVGLGHSYSRSKIKLDPKKQDKSIINSIAVIEALDKNINLFSMRVTEWYGWHFPELKNIITDPHKYCELVHLIRIKEDFDFEKNHEKLLEIVKNEEVVEKIKRISKASVGQELSEDDLNNIMNFSKEVLSLVKTRNRLAEYLDEKLNVVAPNLKELLGNTLSARLISHAGSLVNLAKYPSSSIQILGSEKALFNSLKGNKKTPKFGILFNSSYISKTPAKLKGKMSRYLSNKSAMAARIDSFGETSTNAYGVIFKKQLEHRIANMIKGVKLSKNIDYINEAEELLKNELEISQKKKKKKVKVKVKEEKNEIEEKKEKKKEKKEKKKKKKGKEKEKEKEKENDEEKDKDKDKDNNEAKEEIRDCVEENKTEQKKKKKKKKRKRGEIEEENEHEKREDEIKAEVKAVKKNKIKHKEHVKTVEVQNQSEINNLKTPNDKEKVKDKDKDKDKGSKKKKRKNIE